ncbi:MAG: sigma 54-interacting transcriptional regulator [Clostridiales Family XIII bacterium]|jgi:transcriptional regulator of acetoin/glycerol metabolism|nr:sigma 54-interacting transcriptional regulator [Clostridiales Family XIII bacterium]
MFRFDDEYRKSVQEAWARFALGGKIGETLLRDEILGSWKRSKSYGVDPRGIKPAVCGEDGIAARIAENIELVRVGRPYMERLYSIVAGSGFYLMLSDRNGIVLDLIGDEDIIREGSKKTNLVVGADRSESYAGTNAIGTCLATGQAIQIWGDEHYIEAHRIYACSGGPIKGENGDIIGCLNLTGLADKVHIHTLGMVLSAVDGISKEHELRRAYAQVRQLNSQAENIIAKLDGPRHSHSLAGRAGSFSATFTFDDIIGGADCLRQAIELGKRAAAGDSTILILGESGTGKELFAQAIHNASHYAKGPFVAINCGALPGSLIESELFGYEAGAFTGASKNGNPGKFELADAGTIFLDEIGDMPLATQASMLRVIQTREVVRIGGRISKRLDVRIIAATNQDLAGKVADKSFREDLYYRLNVISIPVPPLRGRKEDIRLLADRFLQTKGAGGTKSGGLSAEAYRLLMGHDWPGNVRELENAIERAVGVSGGGMIGPQHLPEAIARQKGHEAGAIAPAAFPAAHAAADINIEELNQAAIRAALRQTSGNVQKAAALLGISRRTLYRKIEKYSLRPYRENPSATAHRPICPVTLSGI